MNDASKKRKDKIKEEIKEFNEYKHTICCDGHYSENDSILYVIMAGPNDSPYVGGTFKINVKFPPKFPSENPIFTCVTPICHINIKDGTICLDSINNYNPETSITDVLTQIFMMLTSPNEDSPLNLEYYKIYRDDLDEYFRIAREMTRQNAKI